MPIGGSSLSDWVQTTSTRVLLLSAFPGNDGGLVSLYEATSQLARVLEDSSTFRVTEIGDLRVTEG